MSSSPGLFVARDAARDDRVLLVATADRQRDLISHTQQLASRRMVSADFA
jgi:hypothetical protein